MSGAPQIDLRARAVHLGILTEPGILRAIEAWEHAQSVDTADAFDVAADALEEIGATESARGARWCANARRTTALASNNTNEGK